MLDNQQHALQNELQPALLAGDLTDIFGTFDGVQGEMRQVMDFKYEVNHCLNSRISLFLHGLGFSLHTWLYCIGLYFFTWAEGI